MPNGTDESVKSLCPNDTDEHEKNYTHKKKNAVQHLFTQGRRAVTTRTLATVTSHSAWCPSCIFFTSYDHYAQWLGDKAP